MYDTAKGYGDTRELIIEPANHDGVVLCMFPSHDVRCRHSSSLFRA